MRVCGDALSNFSLAEIRLRNVYEMGSRVNKCRGALDLAKKMFQLLCDNRLIIPILS